MGSIKTEEQLLSKAIEILNSNGTIEAYKYLLSQKEHLNDYSSQLYNFLYCLASSTGAKGEALAWLREAIVQKGYWYRPEVFEDEDLDLIRDSEEFLKYKNISDEKYYKALETTNTICTWREKSSDKLALILHGNQQNMFSGRDYWCFLKDEGYQIEYVQSKTIDSYNLYRWEDKGEVQLDKIASEIYWGKYSHTALCGFSAGCNEILKTLAFTDVACDKVILICPWIPVLDENLDEITTALKNKTVDIVIVCGENDKDCLPYAKKLHKVAEESGIRCNLEVVKGCGHNYPHSC